MFLRNLSLLIACNLVVSSLIFSMSRDLPNPIHISNKSNYDLKIKLNKLELVSDRVLYKDVILNLPAKSVIDSIKLSDLSGSLEIFGSVKPSRFVSNEVLFSKLFSQYELGEIAQRDPSKTLAINVEIETPWFSKPKMIAQVSAIEELQGGWEAIEAEETPEGFVQLPSEEEISTDIKYFDEDFWAKYKDISAPIIGFLSSYTFVKWPELTGERFAEGDNFRDIIAKIEESKRSGDIATLEKIAGNYKIHLMPKIEDLEAVVVKLARAIVRDKELAEVIYLLKILNPKKLLEQAKDIQAQKLESQDILPRIVVYPSTGKENAQKALDKLIQLFYGQEGLDVIPRYNQKVTSLIYFAQGNADCKKDSRADFYFEKSKMIYYKPDFTGRMENYRLRF